MYIYEVAQYKFSTYSTNISNLTRRRCSKEAWPEKITAIEPLGLKASDENLIWTEKTREHMFTKAYRRGWSEEVIDDLLGNRKRYLIRARDMIYPP
jgi:hypothetical protein